MKRALIVVGSLILFAAAAAPEQTRVDIAADESALRKSREALTTVRNKHDAKALAAMYSADGDRVTESGVFSGRTQIEKSFTDIFNGVAKNDSVKDDAVKVRFLTADVALVEVDDTVAGRTDGARKNHGTHIYVKRNGEWVLVAQRLIRMQ